MLTRFFRSQRPALQDLYAGVAEKWQSGIDRLGFPGAYRSLMHEERRNRPDNFTAGKIADIGTGSGAFARAYLEAGNQPTQITLSDNCDEMLPIARDNLSDSQAEILCLSSALGEDLPESYDILLCAHVVEHTPDAGHAFRWLHDQLRPGGRLILSLSKPHWCTALVRWRWGHKAYTPNETREMLSAAGFSHVQIIPYRSGPPSRVSCGYIAQKD